MADRAAPVVRVARGVTRVLGLNPGPFTLDGTNTYLLGEGERRLLVDTGDGAQPRYFELLRECLGGSGRIDRILLTHWHGDHIGGVRGLLAMPDLVAPGCTVHKRPAAAADGRDAVRAVLDPVRAQGRLRPIADAEAFDVPGGLRLEAAFTPGHAEDHTAFVLRLPGSEQRLLLTGDLVLGRGSAVVEDLGPYMDSLRRALAIRPAALLPGHGPTVGGAGDAGDGGEAVRAIEGYIEHRNARERQIVAALARPPPRAGGWRVDEVAAAVYPDITDPPLVLAARRNTLLHLRKLVRDGRAAERHTADCGDLYSLIESRI
ncbi:Beta-lactamase-like protein 2 [Coemansia javaensis]|uniref:Beta-lactamase-like protein 2 n=1 Tax=Coemansia javaensis TaxID=2761396 RepID=A0A9W8HF78_9FUNG|nr:Beta-lactamase-like protein 2 [Coemansia javaensis]